MNKMIDRGTRVLFCVFLGIILILLVFFSGLEHACQRGFLLPNLALMPGVLLMMAAAVLLPLRAAALPSCRWLVLGLCAALFFAQSFVVLQICFHSGWDVAAITEAAQTLAFGDMEELDNGYFSTYPNNLLMASIAAAMMKLGAALGFEDACPIVPLLLLNCFFNTVSCALVYRVLRLLARPRAALCGFALSVALVGFSPWTSIPYTDALALLFPILLLFLYLRPAGTRHGKGVKWALFGALAAVGYAFKPQTLIVPIAVVLVELGMRIGRGQGKRLLSLLLTAALAGGCFAGVQLGLNALYEREGFCIEPDERFGASHFLMMGLNEQSNGAWSAEDVAISAECNGAQERTATNLAESARRLSELGVVGYARHLAKKALVTFDDGTFAWGMEGDFFIDEYDAPLPALAPMLRSVFYPHGAAFPAASTLAQGLWLLVLCLSFCAGLCAGGGEAGRNVLLLTLVGLMLFSALFETRARYLYHFAPVFCVAAALGLQTLRDAAIGLRRRLRPALVR